MWTQFWDMSSGGSQKLDWHFIYIEAPEDEAKVIFYNRFGRSPDRVTCTCCGADYSTHEDEDLAQLTGYHRGCDIDEVSGKYIEKHKTKGLVTMSRYCTLEEYKKAEGVLFIHANEIEDRERIGEVPRQGYVWAG